MQQDKNPNLSKENQRVDKKIWLKPEVEIIATDNIVSGTVPNGPEGVNTVFPGSGFKYHTS